MIVEERISVLEANQKNFYHQIDEIKEDVNDIHKLAASVEVIASETRNISQKVDKIDNRLSDVEKQPVADFNHYKRTIIACIFTTVMGCIIGAILAGVIK